LSSLRVLLTLALLFGALPANAANNPTPTLKKSSSTAEKSTTEKKPVKKKPVKKKPVKKKPVKKKPVKKKPVKKKPIKKKVRKTAKPIPIPKAKWPPKGFKLSNGIYYSSPKNEKELVTLLTSKKTLAADIKNCKKFICTVIQVAAEEKCSAWQFTSRVVAYDGKPLGSLTSLRKGSKGKIVATYFLISPEPLTSNSEINRIVTTCIRGPVAGEIPSDKFVSALQTLAPSETQTENQPPAGQ
jgi:hypothetical protein